MFCCWVCVGVVYDVRFSNEALDILGGGKVFLGGGYWGVSICGLRWCLRGILCLGWFNFVCFFLFCLLLCVLFWGGGDWRRLYSGRARLPLLKLVVLTTTIVRVYELGIYYFSVFFKKVVVGRVGDGGVGRSVYHSAFTVGFWRSRLHAVLFFWWRVVRREGDPLPLGGR